MCKRLKIYLLDIIVSVTTNCIQVFKINVLISRVRMLGGIFSIKSYTTIERT